MYEKFDNRKTVEQLDENLEGDENYENMMKTYDDLPNLANASMNEDETILKNYWIMTMNELAKMFQDPKLINEKAIEENLDLITEIFKDTIYEIKEEE